MKNTITVGILSFLAGAILLTSIYEYVFMPLRMKRVDSYSMGMNDMRDQIIDKTEKEFGTFETITPSASILISDDKKVVALKNVDGVKTIRVYKRENSL